jgi:serine/threonine protein kinase/tetratricopeptide (TPR) repeat protein
MDEKSQPEAVDVQRTTDLPSPAAPAVSADVTTALDASTSAKDTSAEKLPHGEPPATEADRPASVPDRSLAFLRPGARPGSLGRLGHFEVLELLGQGGFGIVLKAFDEKLQRLVAIKVLGPQLAGNANARARFVREARAAAAVNSKHVVSTFEVEEQPIPYLVMEYVAGQTLQDHLDQRGPLETRAIIRLGAEIAEGLAAAHKQGLIHRDIKPANILLQRKLTTDVTDDADKKAGPGLSSASSVVECQAKIADFGLARAADDASLTQSGVIAGTPMFMSPEQARGEALDHRSDLFSLGSVLYTMCTGQPPFRANKTLGILKRVCDDTPRPIRDLNAAIPDALTAIVNMLLVKDPAGRFQTAVAVADLLRQHLAHLDDPSLAPPPAVLVGGETVDHLRVAPAGSQVIPSRKKRAWSRGDRFLLWVAAACAVLLVGGGLLLFVLPPRQTQQSAPRGDPGPKAEPPPVVKTDPPVEGDPVARAAAGAAARGEDSARRGQWAQAAKEALAEVAAKPGDRLLWTKAAPRLILAGDVEGYRQLCKRMFEQFRDTTLPEQADSLCKLLLLLPDGSGGLELPSRIVAEAVEKPTTEPYYRGWFYACLALVAYRDGKFEQAADCGKNSLAIKESGEDAAGLALLVLAMAQHQSQQADQARKSLADATALIPPELATLGSGDYQGPMPVAAKIVGNDWLIAEVLRREAALLILKDARRPLDAAGLRSRGLVLFNQGKLDDALAAFRQALALEERHGWNHYLVGVILARQEKADEAIPEFRRAMEISPDYAPPYASLGALLAARGQVDEAIPLLEKAIELEPKLAPAHSALGGLLLHQGKLDEAAARLSKAVELAPRDALAAQMHAEVLRLQRLLPKLDQFVAGTAEPADNGQRLDLARLCSYRQRFAAAARFYAAALGADPNLADDAARGHRYSAACAAARAAHGDGDAAPLDAAARSQLRKQAVVWLRAELDAAAKPLAAGKPAERSRLVTRLRQWKTDADLASLRDPDEVGKLPDDERASLKGLWSDLDAALKPGP